MLYVAWGFHLFFFAFARKVHEALHQLEALGNEMHAGHTFHFCARSWHAFRLLPHLHASQASLLAAAALQRDGDEWGSA